MVYTYNFRLSPKIFENKLFSVQAKALRLSGYLIDKTQKHEFWHFCRSVFFTFSLALCCALEFGKLVLSYGQQGGSAMSPATAFLYLTTSIAIHTAFFRRKRIARMLNFLQRDLDKLQTKSDELEEKFFVESHKYMHLITVCIWTPSLVAGFMAYTEAFYMMAFVPDIIFNLDNIKNSSDTQPLLTRLFPFREVHDDLFVGYILPLYALFLGIMAIPLWHTFITGMMSYVILKWRIMHKRLSTMDVRIFVNIFLNVLCFCLGLFANSWVIDALVHLLNSFLLIYFHEH